MSSDIYGYLFDKIYIPIQYLTPYMNIDVSIINYYEFIFEWLISIHN